MSVLACTLVRPSDPSSVRSSFRLFVCWLVLWFVHSFDYSIRFSVHVDGSTGGSFGCLCVCFCLFISFVRSMCVPNARSPQGYAVRTPFPSTLYPTRAPLFPSSTIPPVQAYTLSHILPLFSHYNTLQYTTTQELKFQTRRKLPGNCQPSAPIKLQNYKCETS